MVKTAFMEKIKNKSVSPKKKEVSDEMMRKINEMDNQLDYFIENQINVENWA